MKKIESQPWWPKLVAKKDEKSLRQLSEEFGASPAAISNALKRNKLTRKAAPSGPRKKDDRAGQGARKTRKKSNPKKRVAKVDTAQAKARRAKPVRTKKAGKAPKAPTALRTARKRKVARPAKAPSRAATTAKSRRRGVRESSLTQYRDQMGKVVDRVIAEKAGVTVSAVTNYRRRHNIPAAGGRGRPRTRVAPSKAVSAKSPAPSKASPRKVRAVSSGTQRYAYRVRIGDKKLIVVATDIAEAARIALRAGKGSVSEIRLLGPALV